MPFKKMLTSLVETVPGASGAILADWEGEAVEQHCQGDSFEMKVTAAHWSILLSRLQALRGRYATGLVQQGVITTHEQHAIIGAIGEDYTLVLTLSRDALPLHALRYFKETARLLLKEIY